MKYTEINQTDKSICSQRLPMIHPEEWGFEGAMVRRRREDEVLASRTATERKVILKHCWLMCQRPSSLINDIRIFCEVISLSRVLHN